MTRILISGATGGIGQKLIPTLSEHALAILTRSRNYAEYKTIIVEDDAKKFPCESIREFDPEIVIHLVGDSTTNINASTLPYIIEANFVFGCQLLNALENTSCRLFLNMRSATEYSTTETGCSVAPAYFFSAVKTSFASMLDFYQQRLEFTRIDCVLYFVYGIYGKKKRVMDYLLESIESETAVAFSPGEQKLDFIHVTDVCRFISYLVEKPPLDTNNCVLHVGTGKVHSLREIVMFLEELTSTKLNVKWGHLSYRPDDVMYSRAPPNNLENFDWSPSLDIREGLKILLKSKGLL